MKKAATRKALTKAMDSATIMSNGEGMGKFETEREFLYQHIRRYLSYVHGGGVRGNPNSGVRINDKEGS